MPPVKGRKSLPKSARNNDKYARKKNAQEFEVNEIISQRILDPNQSNITLQFLVSWRGFGPDANSWEPLDVLRLNTVFIDYINKKFRESEAAIFVNIANIKERIKYRRRKALYNDLKLVTMQQVYPFDPFEFKVYQVVFNLLDDPPKKFLVFMEDLVFRSHFFKLEECQRIKNDARAQEMTEKEGIKISIQNDIDFEIVSDFNYVTKNFCTEELLIANETLNNTLSQENLIEMNEKKVEGCKCAKNMCSKDSNCCPKLLGLPFAYKEVRNYRKVALNRQEPIIECNDNCTCGPNCLNRVTQQPRNLNLCLFKTENRGWAVKTLEAIKKGLYLLEYTGELLGCGIVSEREETSYLFDVNMDRLSHGYYTVDAFKHGNLARFINHSCDPNSSMWPVSNCLKDPKKQRLCIFALRDIERDEEITIDYSPIETIPTTDRSNRSYSYHIECFCGSKACRGTIYNL